MTEVVEQVERVEQRDEALMNAQTGAMSSVTLAERAEYQTYERARRRRLLAAIAPAGVILAGLACLVATASLIVNPQQDASVWVNDALTFALAISFALAWVALRRGRLGAAATIAIWAGSGGVLATVTIACFAQGLTPLSLIQVASLVIAIALIGLLGDLRAIIIGTAIINVVTVIILLRAPRPEPLQPILDGQIALILSVTLTYQWAVAVVMIAIWLTYQQTLRALGVSFARAQRLDTLKAQFITHINHELRTPIMTLQGYIDYLRLGRKRLPEQEVDRSLEKASRTADTLVDLLTSVLDIRRIEADDSFAAESVPMRAALDGAMALIDPRVSEGIVRDLRVEIPDGLTAWGDRARTQQILTNLLSNALKYSPPETPIEVTAQLIPAPTTRQRLGRRRAEPAQDQVEIVVRDYGQGIPVDQLSLLFNRFVRLPRDLASNVAGTGLGLYLCRVFAQGMGGTITAESSGVPGEGTAFTLRLPADLSNPPTSA
ncbi:MAG TPA: HAMP domain-containing sensor histidine kinase [Ktedonobacterales bacterium]|jgi:signal transduction histidine kinase